MKQEKILTWKTHRHFYFNSNHSYENKHFCIIKYVSVDSQQCVCNTTPDLQYWIYFFLFSFLIFLLFFSFLFSSLLFSSLLFSSLLFSSLLFFSFLLKNYRDWEWNSVYSTVVENNIFLHLKVKRGIKAHFPTTPKLKSLLVGGICESFAQNTKCLVFRIVLTSWESIVNIMGWTSE